MAIPSGSGTEVLKFAYAQAVSTGASTLITGVANHIYTIISIIITENANAAEQFNIKITDSDGSSNVHYIMGVQDIAGYDTFIMNDKFVISGDKKLIINTEGAADLDVYVSYIDQDWT